MHSLADGATLPEFYCSLLFLHQIQTLFRSLPPHLEYTRFCSDSVGGSLLQVISLCITNQIPRIRHLSHSKVELLHLL